MMRCRVNDVHSITVELGHHTIVKKKTVIESPLLGT